MQNSKVKNPTDFYQSRGDSGFQSQTSRGEPSPFYGSVEVPVCSFHPRLRAPGASMRRLSHYTKAFALGLLQERCGSNPPYWGYEVLQSKTSKEKREAFFLRSRGDSNPRNLSAQRFSRPPPSTARTPLQMFIN